MARIFVQFDEYETEILKKYQKEIKEATGRYMTLGEIIRGSVRYHIHDVKGEDYLLSPERREEAKKRLSENPHLID